jgi:hypothetical protein
MEGDEIQRVAMINDKAGGKEDERVWMDKEYGHGTLVSLVVIYALRNAGAGAYQ